MFSVSNNNIHILCVSDSEGDGLNSLNKFPSDVNVTYSQVTYQRNNPDPKPVYEFCEANKVDLILAVPQPHVDLVCGFPWIKEINANKALMWYDIHAFPRQAEEMSKYVLNIVLDDQHYKNGLSLWTPVDIPFHPYYSERDIAIFFSGSLDNNRKKHIKSIIEAGFPVFYTDMKVSYDRMCNFMRRSKIILNFSKNRHAPGHQFKGRVLEAIRSGAMLLEDKNNQSTVYFQPDKEIIHWDNNLIEKIDFYLKNDQERLTIARQGQEKSEELSVKNWWSAIFSKLKKPPIFT